ncbi:Beta-lactamase class A OS=Singulisphaera acidiphila (strain ATCC BAA-1392 / DSM 18658 / VKM B-2454 / MOB10) GN=Sinac_7069 PE=4 SV=1: Beta-lactamase2 [Gemmata massiliana]|uniref:beta-lactamase n=1 Tax=Gemmata massiliana TaxID=1210884 RepID=A0A6P2D3F3_9BACT|nr:serine hydrolase [Gemmata massiliana]VTR95026.1 Beta-lactamase class A OS=Singulisphaera acidiphila (strain ATCC BAA-1392 / DSM 18658 / VKM B-2454 / MOB10) GN=Sinac_7069 PE=4 SV=1: Beta-lactamase2 [Gemmata massiliana]
MRLVTLAATMLFAAPSSSADLESRIAPLAKDHKGKVAVAVKHLKTGEEFYLNADEAMPTASLIKLPVMVETYWQAHEEKVKLDTKLTLTKDDKVGGSGILTSHFSDGATFPLKDAVRLMIVYSDNTATNMVLDQIGIPSTNTRMEKLGLKNTKVHAKVFKGSTTSIDKARTDKYGLGSTTAKEMVQLLELIETGKVASPEACKEMLGHLKACDDKEKMTRYLPAGTVVAHKTGSVNASKTDAGIVYLKSGPVVLCVLTDGNDDKRWVADNAAQVLIGKIAKEVYEHYGEKKEEKK